MKISDISQLIQLFSIWQRRHGDPISASPIARDTATRSDIKPR